MTLSQCGETTVKHLELVEIAKLLTEDPSTCRHLGEICPTCGDRLQQVEALMKRFQHWNPEVAVLEGLPAEALFMAILAAGTDLSGWSAQVEGNAEFQTWGVAWVALETARAQLSDEASSPQARDLALLAAKIAESLGAAYHPDYVEDLKARAQAIAAAAETPDVALVGARLKRIAAAVTALELGTGEEAVSRDVWNLLSRVIR